jgi:ribosomal protein S18 acetylase RimI-like enzyme
MPILEQALEQAAFSAWPALEEHDRAGWRLRFANGYTKRANSANAIGPAVDLTPSQIDDVEAFYRARGARAVFRLASFSTDQAGDDALADRGYRFADMSLVMTKRLDAAGPAEACELLPDAKTWLHTTAAVSDESGAGLGHHLQILSAIKGACAFAVLRRDGRPVCRGLAVADGDHVGLFDIETHPDSRGTGLATRLCEGLMAWGARQGATTAYLQVVTANTDAIGLYERLGFRRRYHYWYRLQPMPSSPMPAHQ